MVMRIDDRQSWFENRFFVPRKPIEARRRVPWRGPLVLCGLLCGHRLRPPGGRAADEHREFASIHWCPPLLRGMRNFFNLPQAGFGAKGERWSPRIIAFPCYLATSKATTGELRG